MVATDGVASEWLRRWDAQQQLHIPDREERFSAMTAALAGYAGERPKVLDLGSGPGSLSVRVLQRLPEAEIVALDTDPVLLAIARGALDPSRVHVVDVDLREAWTEHLPIPPPFDAAVSTTALHWLRLDELLPFYRRLAGVLAPGGVFLDGDRFEFDHDQRTIGDGAVGAQPEWPPVPDAAEDWPAWWAAVEAQPEFFAEAELRHARHYDHPHDHERHTYEFHRAALLAAGFSEVGTIWQRLVNRVLIAIR